MYVCVLSCTVMSDSLWLPWTSACQTPLSVGFSRKKYWSGLPFPTQGDLPDSGIEPVSPVSSAWQAGSLPLSHLGNLEIKHTNLHKVSWILNIIILPVFVSGLPWWFKSSLVAHMVKSPPARQETQVWSLGWEDSLEEEMATYSIILAWKIPWTKESGGLQSMGLQRVGHDWVINTFTDGSSGKESACSAEGWSSVPGSRRYPGEGNSVFLPGEFMDRGAWRTTVHGVTKSWAWLSD